MPGFANLARRVRAHLGQEARYLHSVRVARCAHTLARRHGLNVEKATLAGLLHDLARLYSGERLIAESQTRALPIEEYELDHPMLLHARLGAAIARESFGVGDADVLSAIEKHTTGAGEMSPLDCAVYLADSLEPGRTFPERAAFWHLATRDLRAAMRAVIASSLEDQRRKGRTPAPPALEAARAFDVELAPVSSEVCASES